MSLHNETLKTIRDRRSIRRYEETMPTREEILTVVEAGRCAPSGGNTQTTRFTVITNPQVLQQLQQLARQEFAKMDCDETTYKSLRHAILASKKGDYPMLYGAPVLILVSNLRTYGNNYSDCACALQNMMLAAHALGLGTVWVHREREIFDSEKGKALLREWKLPDTLCRGGKVCRPTIKWRSLLLESSSGKCRYRR